MQLLLTDITVETKHQAYDLSFFEVINQIFAPHHKIEILAKLDTMCVISVYFPIENSSLMASGNNVFIIVQLTCERTSSVMVKASK